MVEYINYKKEQIPICIDMQAMFELEKEGLDLGKDNNSKAMVRLFWHSLKAGYFHEHDTLKDFPFSEDTVNFIFGACFFEFKEKMMLFLKQVNQEMPETPKAKRITKAKKPQ